MTFKSLSHVHDMQYFCVLIVSVPVSMVALILGITRQFNVDEYTI